MAPRIDATQYARNPIVQEAAIAALRNYAAIVLREPEIEAPNQGHKVYAKRIALAQQALASPGQFAERAAFYIEQVTNGSVRLSEDNGITLVNYMIQQNQMGMNIFQADANQIGNLSDVGTTSGQSIFDVLANVSADDLT